MKVGGGGGEVEWAEIKGGGVREGDEPLSHKAWKFLEITNYACMRNALFAAISDICVRIIHNSVCVV